MGSRLGFGFLGRGTFSVLTLLLTLVLSTTATTTTTVDKQTIAIPNVSPACSKGISDFLADPYTLFQVVQGSGKYPGDWGYVDTCEMVETAHYCFLEFKMDHDEAVKVITDTFGWLTGVIPPPFASRVNLTEIELDLIKSVPSYIPAVEYGICLPEECTDKDIRSMVRRGNNNATTIGTLSISCLPSRPDWSVGAIIVVVIGSFLVFLVLVGSAVDYGVHYVDWANDCSSFNKKYAGEYSMVPIDEEEHIGDGEMDTYSINPTDDHEQLQTKMNDDEEGGVQFFPSPMMLRERMSEQPAPVELKDPSEKRKKGFVDFSIYDKVEEKTTSTGSDEIERSIVGFFRCWSAFYNLKKLFTSSSTPRLDSLNGMRVMSMGWVILAHTLGYQFFYSLPDNIFYLLKSFQDDWKWQIPLSAFFAVDTFFFIAGFLVSFLLVKELVSKGRVNWLLYYFHRIWRICPVYFYIFFFYWKVLPYLGDGPKWESSTTMELCNDYWWANLLYIQNFIPWNFANECMGWAWYLAVDMQYYIFTPFIIYPFFRWKKIGWGLVAILTIGCFFTNLALAWGFDMSYWYGSNFETPFFNEIYTKPYARAYPYLMGLALGFFMCEKRQSRFEPPGWLVLVLVLIAFATMGAVVFGPADLYAHSTIFDTYGSWTKAQNISYITLSRLAWGVALALLVYVCIKKPHSWLQWFLAHPIWTPLARLTFTAYLIHPILITGYYASWARPYHYSPTSFAYLYLGNLVFAYIFALGTFLVLERPLMNLEKFLLPAHKRPSREKPKEMSHVAK